MPVTLPKSVRTALGEEAADDLNRYLKELLEEYTISLSEYRSDMSEVKTRLTAVERGQTELHQEMSGLRQEVREEINGLHQEMTGLRQEMYKGFDQINERILIQTRWLIGAVSLFGTILSILLAIGQLS